jgi:8-oxo-dGTP pyrophosphatase MutT (NUDIX family)
MFLTKDDRVLLLKRSEEGDAEGLWCFPGGKVEDDEDSESAARREVLEETGHEVTAPLALWTRRIKGGVDFTTYLCRVNEPFGVELNGEHTAYAWLKPGTGKVNMHPGVLVALARLHMDELGVARTMAAGELSSPQRYGRFYLFDIRITGTGLAYRDGRDEYVWRDESIYVNDEFLARCAGLPVIYCHPEKKPALDSDEFHDRIVGTVFVPYMKGEEVWAVCRIYDDSTITLLLAGEMSTSPGVVFDAATSTNETMRMADGGKLLIEGGPALLDHIAICEKGVWDKGGPAAGRGQHGAGRLGPCRCSGGSALQP